MLFKNKLLQPSPTPDKASWLASERPGPYTTARTIDGFSIVEAGLHVRRIADTARSILQRIADKQDRYDRSLPEAAQQAQLCSLSATAGCFVQHVRHALQVYSDSQPMVEEKRITYLVNWDADGRVSHQVGQNRQPTCHLSVNPRLNPPHI